MLRLILHLLKPFWASLQSCHLVLEATNYEMYTLIVVLVSSRLIVISIHELKTNRYDLETDYLQLLNHVYFSDKSKHINGIKVR